MLSLFSQSILASLLVSSAVQAVVPAQLFSGTIPTKILKTAQSLPAAIQYPQYTTTSGTWLLFSPDTWTSGFFPVTLYGLNTRKNLCPATTINGLGIANWLALGRSLSAGLVPLETKTSVGHDVGFLSFPFAEELVINPTNQTAINAVNQFAKELAARYSPIVGCTRSWDNSASDPATNFQVIIDNMMNLEVLFLSAALTGNTTLTDIAKRHADTTMKNHFRADGSTWHVVVYNSATGAVVSKHTSQGFSDSSTWARGQAWAVYGFANMFKHTGDTNYLTTARNAATYFLNNIPANGVIPWDFNAPVAGRPADSSAATIVANGLLLLSQQETSASLATQWQNAAIAILNNVTALAWNPSWQSLLSNGTVNKPADNFLTGTVYGDYYYLRAGNELLRTGLAQC
ncbi:glucuronyl hydrolase [Mycena floridula]|nr:glucuronyl hydrolase [Mycena floridula]